MRHVSDIDPNPVIVHGLGSRSPFLLTCDHAGRAVPASLGRLGLAEAEFDRHIAWDIGAAALSLRLGQLLGAGVIQQAYSRLVIDCNRAPGTPESIPSMVDRTPIPANTPLSAADAAARLEQIDAPYHQAIADELDRRTGEGLTTTILFIHSFTPSLAGRDRPWHFGVLHGDDSSFSLAVLTALRAEFGDLVGDNQPYKMDETDYSAGRHARSQGHDYLELEVRQDLIADEANVERIAALLAPILTAAHSV